MIYLNNTAWRILKRESFGLEKIQVISKSKKNKKRDKFLEFRLKGYKFKIDYKVIYDKSGKLITYKFIDSIKIDNKEILKERNLYIPQKIGLSYEELLVRISKVIFRTYRQHYIPQSFLNGWKNIHDNNYNEHGFVRKSKSSVFYSKNIYTTVRKGRIYYFEDGFINIFEEEFDKSLSKLHNKSVAESKIQEIIDGCAFMTFRHPSIFKSKQKLLFEALYEHTQDSKLDINEFKKHLFSEFHLRFKERLNKNTKQKSEIKALYINIKETHYLNKIKLPLTDNFACFHTRNCFSHQDIKFDFFFFPISEDEFVILFADEYLSEANNIIHNKGIKKIIEFYTIFSGLDLGSFIISGKNIPEFNPDYVIFDNKDISKIVHHDIFF